MPALALTAAPGVALRPGPNGLQREQVNEIQRARLVAATFDSVHELGYARTTVAEIIDRARVSRKTFYDIFLDREDCFLAAFEQALARASSLAIDSYQRKSSWREGTRAALASLLALLDEEPSLARLCVLEAPAAGERVLQRREDVLEELAELIDRGRLHTTAARRPPRLAAEGIVGGILAVLHTRLLQGEEEHLSDLLGALMSMIVLPYLGPRAARAELGRSSRKPRRTPALPTVGERKDPLEGLNIRLTYRTVRVLTAIAESPGASNREIAERSDIVDQGQISKLLNRLAGLGLAENLGAGQQHGATNEWHLSPRGEQLEQISRRR